MSSDDEARRSGQALSALVDGELAGAETARLLRRLGREPALRARWARHHTVRSALEGVRTDRLGPGSPRACRPRSRTEPAAVAPLRRRAPPRWLRPVAGVAIAASVALVAMGGLFALQRQPAGPDLRVSSLEGGTPAATRPGVPAAVPTALTVEGESVASQATRARIGVYLATHSEYAPAAGLPGLVPYSRLTGFNAGR
ncbi:MAG: sigma-E factor negative regulatory protein [Halofilum sp. (in: g-proteobacteria)]|nr:sigma-E factor negative regulatory protein [Halofilum sp. (in: g-proteobacteria)]